MIAVYIIKNIKNGKRYVGQTTSLHARWQQHRYEAAQPNTHPLYRAIRKYGISNFVMIPLLKFRSQVRASQFEKALIKNLRTLSHEEGYNLDLGGHAAGKHSKNTKIKIGLASSGRRHTKQTRKKMSLSQKGKLRSSESRKNISIGIRKQWANPIVRKHKIEGLKKSWVRRKLSCR